MKEAGGGSSARPGSARAAPAERQRQTDIALQELRANLQQSLERIVEETRAGEQLRSALAAAEGRIATVERALAEREHELAARLTGEIEGLESLSRSLSETGSGGASQRESELVAAISQLAERARELSRTQERYAAEVENVARDRASLRSDAGLRQQANLEQRLRTAEATLARTLQEVEEQRVAAVELRVMLEATEHRAASDKRELTERAQRAEARFRQVQSAAAEHGQQQSEEARVASAELTTMLGAMEYRASQLEAAVAARELELNDLRLTAVRDQDEWQSIRGALQAELQAAREETTRLLASQQEMAASQATLQEQVDQERAGVTSLSRQITALQEERRRLITALEEETAGAAQTREAVAGLTEEREGALREREEFRATASARAQEIDALRAESERARAAWEAERTSLAARVEAGQKENSSQAAALAEAAAKASTLEQALREREEQIAGLDRRARETEEEHARVAAALERAGAEGAVERERVAQAASERAAALGRVRELEEHRREGERKFNELQEATNRARADWETARNGLAAEKAKLRAECEALKVSVDELEAARQRLGQLEDEVQRGAERHRELAAAHEQVTGALAARGEQLAEMAAAHGAAVERTREREETLGKLERELDVQRAHHAEGSGALRTQLAGLAAELIEVKKALQATEEGRGNERALSEGQRAELARELATVHEQLRQESEKNVALTAQLERVDTAHQNATGELRTVSVAREAAEKHRATAEERIQSLIAELASVRDEHYTSAGENAQLLAEVQRLGEARSTLEQRLQETQGRLADEQKALSELRELHEHGTELYHLVEGELREARQSAARQIDELTGSLEERTQEAATLREQGARAASERDAVQERVGKLEKTGAQSETELATLRRELAQSEAAVAELRAATSKLEENRATLEQNRAALEARVTTLADRDALAAKVDELQRALARAGAVEQSLRESRAEADRLKKELGSATGERDGLQKEREQLRKRATLADEAERQKEENARLAARLQELDHQQAESTQRHSQAVSGYMLELNQRTELLRQRELQIEKLTEEMRGTQKARDEATTQLAAMRQERELLELKVRELETTRPARPVVAAEPSRPAAASPSSGLRLAPSAAPAAAASAKGAPAEPAPQTPKVVPQTGEAAAAKPRGAGGDGTVTPGRLTVVHVEDDPALQEKVRTAVAGFSRTRYLVGKDTPAGPPPGPTLLAVNLLARGADPLETLTRSIEPGTLHSRALTYCAEGGRGVHFGLTDVFPHPFNLESCAKRLMARPGAIQRLLVVGETVELLNEMRSAFAQMRCSISVALDARQAYDLVEMVKPQLILVDLGLPRGEGLRLTARLRSDPNQAATPLALMWARAIDAGEFRTQTLRVIRDYLFRPDDLGRGVQQAVTEAGYRTEPMRDAG